MTAPICGVELFFFGTRPPPTPRAGFQSRHPLEGSSLVTWLSASRPKGENLAREPGRTEFKFG
jgi:hypothetical protein